MKRIIISFYLIITFFFGYNVNAQSSKKEEKAQKKLEAYQKVVSLIESGKFEFQARKANPQRGRQIDLATNPNYLRVDQDNVKAEMPYFGVVQSGLLSGESGVKFDGESLSYVVDKDDKKQKVTIKFKVRDNGESYNCILSVSGESNATLSISFNRRDRISYYGGIYEIK